MPEMEPVAPKVVKCNYVFQESAVCTLITIARRCAHLLYVHSAHMVQAGIPQLITNAYKSFLFYVNASVFLQCVHLQAAGFE
jgi:hypothetical protein